MLETELDVQSTEELEEAVALELEKEDPDLESAEASIKKATAKEVAHKLTQFFMENGNFRR